ncbi:MAG: oxygenase MpaB family protein [Nitriliruptorales bacterium]|nr:oxygenase MpaB family protein [Nitriliruptorales bacterium]
MRLLARHRRWVVDDFERQVGRHDQHSVFGGPAGDPGLVGGPESVSWRIHGDVASIAIASVGAIVLEILHPSVMAGVQDQSSYADDPLRRARTTYGYVVTTTFGNTEKAERLIAHVKRLHAQVNGVRPDGVPYRALDPALIAWVHTCIPWAIMTAYDRFCEPLSRADKDQYLAEQSVVGLLGGADWVPASVSELEAFVEDVRPQLAVNHQTRAFFDFLLAGHIGPIPFPDRVPDAVRRPIMRFQVEAGMGLMPRWARQMAGFAAPAIVQRTLHDPAMWAFTRRHRWAFGAPTFKQLAVARARGVPADRDDSAAVASGARQ